MGYAIRTGRHRYVKWREWQTGNVEARELYNHHSDPNEMRNLASNPEQSEVLLKLEQQLAAGPRMALPPDQQP